MKTFDTAHLVAALRSHTPKESCCGGDECAVHDAADYIEEAMTCEPVGLTEIAERLGVQPHTATMWNYRGLLPEPSWFISGRPAWNWPEVEAWARESDRLE